ncbi:hypothetical protein LCE31_37570, partial [Streptomyces sp. 8L]|nr:hypothetical protein [Streptomyces sp. 8L]
METVRAPRRNRPADPGSPPCAEPTHQRTATPIYNALVREWRDAGRAAPTGPTTSGSGRRHRPQ